MATWIELNTTEKCLQNSDGNSLLLRILHSSKSPSCEQGNRKAPSYTQVHKTVPALHHFLSSNRRRGSKKRGRKQERKMRSGRQEATQKRAQGRMMQENPRSLRGT
jgi:hypothetical protein